MLRKLSTGLAPPPTEVVVALDPVYNILAIMAALWKPSQSGGSDEWVARTAAHMQPDVRQRHAVLFGAFYLDSLTQMLPGGVDTADFPRYLAAVAAHDPVTLRDSLLDGLRHSPNTRILADAPVLPAPARSALLADAAGYIRYQEQVAGKDWPPGLLAEAHALLNDPLRLRTTIVAHLQQLWQTAVAAEWARVYPLLQESVDAFRSVNFAGLSILEAMQVVTGRNLRSLFRQEALLGYRRVRFIPHLHSGPYIALFGDLHELCVLFPARRPQRHPDHQLTALDQAELVNRLSALADATRLQILAALREAGELSTQEIMARFRLNKSAASRHLRQLYANNLISERREEGAKKVYGLNAATINEAAQLLSRLGGHVDGSGVSG